MPLPPLRSALPPLILLCTLWVAPVRCQEWTRFRGPNGSGVSSGPALPAQWTETDYRWQITLPGRGHASPVVWNDRVFVVSADPETAERHMTCVRADAGQTLWQRTYPSAVHPLHARNTFASSTPTVDAEHVYVAWATPEQLTLRALDHDGAEVWLQDLGPHVTCHGFGTSPLLFEDLVILFDSQEGAELEPGQSPGISRVMAFDRRTGTLRWRTERTTVRQSYSTPCLYHPPGGPPQLLGCDTAHGFFSLDPRTGAINWSLSAFTMRTVASPIVVGNMVFACNGSGGGGAYLVAARIDPQPHEAYRVTRQAPYVSTPVARDDLLFFCSDRGFVSCLHIADGTVVWSKRVTSGFSGSPVLIGDKLYCLDEDGNVWVLAADREFQELGCVALGESSRSTPAVAGGQLFLRTETQLFCIGVTD